MSICDVPQPGVGYILYVCVLCGESYKWAILSNVSYRKGTKICINSFCMSLLDMLGYRVNCTQTNIVCPLMIMIIANFISTLGMHKKCNHSL